MVEADFSGKMRTTYYSAFEKIEDMEKVLCWLTGVDYYETTPLRTVIDNDRGEFGKWHDAHHFFRVRGYKKGTMHFEFKSEDVWAMFNRKVAELKGYPLFEHKELRFLLFSSAHYFWLFYRYWFRYFYLLHFRYRT